MTVRMTPAQRERYEERAAILEYDAGMTRFSAECEAWNQVMNSGGGGNTPSAALQAPPRPLIPGSFR